MLPFVVGDTVLDVGPGGGAMLDRLAAAFPEKRVVGIDVARNVVEALERRRHAENRPWEIVRGDALALSEHFTPGSVSTVLFSSVLHELFSYLPYHGRRFNHGAVKAALGSAFEILAPGGRIIIRDGIMTEPKEQRVIIRFRSDEGMECLKQYCQDFRGRPITFLVVGHLEAQMQINDAMEFLYTYTWGDEAYVHEVQEQFGYFTPSEFEQAIAETLGPGARILENRHYLQPGYTLALEPKIEFLDERRRPIPLPDSTCLIVIEKAF